MRVEPRGGGLRQRKRETRPYTERTLPVSTRLERFTHKARSELHTRFNALMGLLFDPGRGYVTATRARMEERRPASTGSGKSSMGKAWTNGWRSYLPACADSATGPNRHAGPTSRKG